MDDPLTRAETGIELANDQWRSNFFAGAKMRSDDVLSSLRKGDSADKQQDFDELLEVWAAQRVKICCLDEALTVFKEASSRRHSWPPGNDSYTQIPIALARAGRVDDLKDLGKFFLSSSSMGDFKTQSLIAGLVDTGLTYQALLVVQSLTKDKNGAAGHWERLAHRLILTNAVKFKNINQIKAAMPELNRLYSQLQRTRSLENYSYSGDDLTEAVKGLVGLGLVKEAVDFATAFGIEVGDERIRERYILDLRYPIAEQLIAAGFPDQALRLVRQIENQFLTGSSADGRTYNLLASEFKSRACSLYAQLAISSIRSKKSDYISDVVSCSPAALRDERDPFRITRFGVDTADILPGVLKALAESGQVEQAVDLASGLSAPRKRSAIVAIARAAATTGKVEAAVKLAEASPDSAQASELLADVFIAAADSGYGGKVDLNKYKVPYADDESRALAALARWHAREKRYREAFVVAQKCSLAKDKLAAYTAVVNEYAKSRKKKF